MHPNHFLFFLSFWYENLWVGFSELLPLLTIHALRFAFVFLDMLFRFAIVWGVFFFFFCTYVLWNGVLCFGFEFFVILLWFLHFKVFLLHSPSKATLIQKCRNVHWGPVLAIYTGICFNLSSLSVHHLWYWAFSTCILFILVKYRRL